MSELINPVSLHTYPIKHFAFIDIFSCKPFDIDMARNYCVDYFGSKSPKLNLIIRGEEFPVN